jgi:hypothetical protein
VLDSASRSIRNLGPSDASRMDGASTGRAGGAPSIEIFRSFHSLVDSLTREKEEPAAASSHGPSGKPAVEDAAPAAAAPKDDETGSIVVPLDLLAQLASRAAAPQGPGGTTPQPGSGVDASGHQLWTAADLAALLRADRGGSEATPVGADAQPGLADLDVVKLSADAVVAGMPGAPTNALDTAGQLTATALAQALAHRPLGPVSGTPALTTEIAGHADASKSALEALIHQATATGERPSSAVPAAALHLAASLTLGSTLSSGSRFAGEVSAASAAPLELPATGTADQIIQSIRMQWLKGGGEAQIRLEPQQFGDMTVSVSVSQNQVVARLQADTPIAREWLQANQTVLRQGLADQNLTLTRLEVSEPSAPSRTGTSRDGQSPGQERRPPRRPRTPDTGETFDVVA